VKEGRIIRRNVPDVKCGIREIFVSEVPLAGRSVF
jgi:hypothetical protein